MYSSSGFFITDTEQPILGLIIVPLADDAVTRQATQHTHLTGDLLIEFEFPEFARLFYVGIELTQKGLVSLLVWFTYI